MTTRNKFPVKRQSEPIDPPLDPPLGPPRKTRFLSKQGYLPIDQGIPIPPIPQRGGGGARYPWHEMKIGDSFLVKNTLPHTVTSAVSRTAQKVGKKFTMRSMTEGVRVWRTA